MSNFIEISQLCLSKLHRTVWVTYKRESFACLAVTVGMFCWLPYVYIMLFVWFLAGIVSSIGLGTGIHTGILFLMPYVASTTNTLNADVWTTWWYVLPPCIAHGIGSAVGELPPYFLATRIMNNFETDSWAMKTHQWMVDCLNTYGSIIIFLFAIYPNAFFDMCGLAAGICNVNVGVFLGATIAGKAFVKAPLIALLVVLASKGAILPEFIQTYLDAVLDSTEGSSLGTAWTTFVAVLTMWMFYRMMEDIARSERAYLESKDK